RRITDGPSDDYLPTWSRDGKYLYFSSDRAGARRLWRVPLDGGAAEPLIDKGSVAALESDDGWLYYAYQSQLWRFDMQSHREERVIPDLNWREFSLTPAGVFFVSGTEKKFQTVEHLDIKSGRRTLIAKQIGPRPNRFGPIVASPDGKTILFDRVEEV